MEELEENVKNNVLIVEMLGWDKYDFGEPCWKVSENLEDYMKAYAEQLKFDSDNNWQAEALRQLQKRGIIFDVYSDFEWIEEFNKKETINWVDVIEYKISSDNDNAIPKLEREVLLETDVYSSVKEAIFNALVMLAKHLKEKN